MRNDNKVHGMRREVTAYRTPHGNRNFEHKCLVDMTLSNGKTVTIEVSPDAYETIKKAIEEDD